MITMCTLKEENIGIVRCQNQVFLMGKHLKNRESRLQTNSREVLCMRLVYEQ